MTCTTTMLKQRIGAPQTWLNPNMGPDASTGSAPKDGPRKALASFKVPRRIITLAQLPLTSTGKISRSELRRRLGQEATNV